MEGKLKKYAKYLAVFIAFCVVAYFFYKPRVIKPKMQVQQEIVEQDSVIEEIVVDIQGAVNNPGVYSLPQGSIVQDVIQKAGGISDKCDLSSFSININQAEELYNHQKIYIPVLSDKSTTENIVTISKISINRATKDELMTLPGIGESTAQKIIDKRPYKKIEDLLNVSGIGESKFDQIKDKISL